MDDGDKDPGLPRKRSEFRNPSNRSGAEFFVYFGACGIYLGPLSFRGFRLVRGLPLDRSLVSRVSPYPLHDLLLQLGITVCSFVFVGCRR